MLAYILAITVAIGSFSFYMAAFFVPEMHRRQDFFWSGLGLFYAVVLWFCAGRLTGAVLLGQLVSVVLLGGLGWHTLALRRDLTPELVQTPVTWDDVQKLTQDLQRLVRKYGRLDDVANFGRAAWGTITQLVTNWRDRAAAIPAADTPSEVPPLKRSPAYEFETAPGTDRRCPQSSPRWRADSDHPRLQPIIQNHRKHRNHRKPKNGQRIPKPRSPRLQPLRLTRPRLPSPAWSPQLSMTLPHACTDAATTAPASAPASPIKPPRQTAAAVPPRPAPPPQSSDQRSSEPARQTNPVTGLVNWVGNLIGAGRKPKPARGVIEIPPRPPSIPKDPNATQAKSEAANPATRPSRSSKSSRAVIDIPPRPPSIPKDPNATRAKAETSTPAARPSRSSKSPRAVIDIPPRPPSIPRSPAAPSDVPAPDSAPSEQATTDSADTNWVDVGDASPAVTDRPTERSSSGTDTDVTEPMPTAADAANWPEAETNWSVTEDDTRPLAATRHRPSGSTATQKDDTNWPDDEDTNWPD
jgi:hypothetical protein